MDGRPQLLSRGDNDERQGVLEDLHVVDYRYSRFALDIQTGLFGMIRWDDYVVPSSILSVMQGLA